MKKETLFNFFKPYYVSDTGQIIWHAFLLELILWARHANLHLRGEESEANRGDNRGSLVDTGRGRLWSQAQRPTVHAPPTPALCNETVAMKTNSRHSMKTCPSPLLSCHPDSSRNQLHCCHLQSIPDIPRSQNERQIRSRHLQPKSQQGNFSSLNRKSQQSPTALRFF